MPFKTIKVGIKPDAIESIGKVSIDLAIEELIWNAIDAEANRIDISFDETQMFGIDRIVVSDDGHGLAHDEAEKIFEGIGGSSKRLKRRSPNLDRPYHGKEGKGRYKTFSLGRKIEWNSRTLNDGSVESYCIKLDSSKIDSAEIGSPSSCQLKPGCDVIVTDLRDKVNGLRSDSRIEKLTHRFAPYLIANPSIRIFYDGSPFDVSSTLSRDKTIEIVEPATEDADELRCNVRILEWSKSRESSLFLCDENGVALDEEPMKLRGLPFSFSAYVLSSDIRKLHDDNRLASGDLDQDVRRFKECSKGAVQSYFRERQAEEAKLVADRIRKEGLYPYSQQPTTNVERAEQNVFDICAATIHEFLPNFENSDKNSRKFTYRLLRESLESSPSNLGKIIAEVLKLSNQQQEELAFLLGRTSLGAIINTAKTVSDRLAFINGLEQVLHDKTIRKNLKERTQLHRILVEELWIFGDEYVLGGDDVSLRTVLNEHRQILGLPDLTKQVPKALLGKLDDVPDLLLWRKYLRGNSDQFEHLVVELKRPTVNVSLDVINQAKRYAAKVMNNRHFDKEKTHWKFIVLSDGIAEDAKEEVEQRDRKKGHVGFGKHHDVWVLTWAEVIHESKIRLNWIQERLEIAVNDNPEGMSYLRKKYSHLLPAKAKQVRKSKARKHK